MTVTTQPDVTVTTQPPADSPEALTGIRVGDRVTPREPAWIDDAGNIHPELIPQWLPIASNGYVVGFMLSNPPPELDGVIFDGSGTVQIGKFVDGLPIIARRADS
ncbi:MAG: hypothetical protein ACK5OX_08900 [Desertimonas sp.]